MGWRAHPSAPALPEDDPFVLHARSLRRGFRLEGTSRYSDDIWRLYAAQHKEHERALILNFPTIPSRFRPAAKKLLYNLLSGPLPEGEDRMEIASVWGTFTAIKRFLVWCDKRWPDDRTDLSELTGRDLDDYRKHLLIAIPDSTDRRQTVRAAPRLLWRWRTNLGVDALLFDPLHLDGWSDSRKRRHRENATHRLPELVLGPLLGWALRTGSLYRRLTEDGRNRKILHAFQTGLDQTPYAVYEIRRITFVGRTKDCRRWHGKKCTEPKWWCGRDRTARCRRIHTVVDENGVPVEAEPYCPGPDRCRGKQKKGHTWRSVRTVYEGRRERAELIVSRFAERSQGRVRLVTGAASEIRRAHYLPATEGLPQYRRVHRRRPAGVADKQRPGFEKKWTERTGRDLTRFRSCV
ncbi:hypothetical protein ACIHCQ_31860 [Streptomyces sp. NPDC052236]|uniref:hypothetical protein n=1 Tax=Streptomyces sp. NPDC052236 TaxID=3365686 RepID=UPI0037D14B75